MIRVEADVAVVGSGFSGSLTALILHRVGLRPVLVDNSFHPRFAIGESSTPIADLVLRDLCDRYDLPRIRPLTAWGTWQRSFPGITGGIKRGFSFFKHESGQPFRPDPLHGNDLLVAASIDDEQSDTHWLRADVDAFFAGEVRREEIPFFEGKSLSPQRTESGWILSGQEIDLHAEFIVDASGGGAFLASVLQIHSDSVRTNSRAIFSHFRGLPLWQNLFSREHTSDYPFPADWAAMHHILDDAWMWMLRFSNGITSAGIVMNAERNPLDAAVSVEAEWDTWIARYPSLRDHFRGAEIVSPPGKLLRTGRLQRRVSCAAGTDWAMLPHAAGFVDPLYSTGIAHSLCGVERLMRIFEQGWGRADFPERLEAYSRSILVEHAFVDRLVHLAYRTMPDFRLFTTAGMFYFAAATSYEHMRANGEDRLFLLADDPRLSAILREAETRPAEEFEAFAEVALEPFNRVGLFHPASPNMYAYTAAPK